MSSNASSDNSKMSSAKTSAKAAKTAAAPAVAAPAPVAEAAAPKAKGGKKAAASTAAAPAPAVATPAPVTEAVVAPVASAAPAEDDVNVKLANAIKRQAEIAHQQKTLASEAASLAKEVEKLAARLAKKAAGRRKRAAPADGSASKNGTAFIKPVPASNELASFLGLEKGAMISRRDVSKRFYAYVKSHGLQKGKVINTDASLRKLLGVTEKDEVTILNLQSFMNKHFIKPVPAAV